MKVAITGASGFLGSYVLEELQTRSVEIIDVRRRPPEDVTHHPRTRWITRDLSEPTGAYAAMGKPDLLIHLAWGGLPHYESSRHIEVELPRQVAFLKSCIDDGLKRVAAAGTCFEYGVQDGELAEETVALPVTRYGVAKNQLHLALTELADEGRVEVDWARFFYLFGPRQAESSLYSQLMRSIDRNDAKFDMSGGEQLRDFLPATEAARLFVDVALATGGAGAVNICSGTAQSVSHLIEQWASSRGAIIRMNKGHFPYSPFEPMAFWGSRKKLDAIISHANKPCTVSKNQPD